ncbi:cupredoxin domain-containing protein [Candidatus Uhrbacteria bacterium]|nr:cupredoxin domain-containing protein [Candidatus Uhrbacteria bacterium]
MKKSFVRAAALVSTLGLAVAPLASSAMTTTAFGPGDLVKGSGSAVYYFAVNGKRYVFPNDKTYFTWYKDFSTVKQLSDGMLSTIPLGGNVTYRPGVKMVKITTDPRTYAVDQSGVLRHVGSEQLAETLYGLNWKGLIDDVPDAFFTNYRVGTAIAVATEYRPADVTAQTTNINFDKQLDSTKMTVTIGTKDNGFVPPTLTVKKGTAVTWTNSDGTEHNVTGNGWKSDMLKYNQSYTYTFNTVGSFDYKDSNFPVMQGTVNVVN